ncbi:MAG: SulP family inorganic anion transporter [Gammaproteobacteria bacterium]|nr:MAG: SulP family inorganic anion transporter [Gammaproteobacteria bacterium]
MSRKDYAEWQLRLFPFLRWKDRVTKETLRADLISGLTVAIVVIPQAVAFASIAGMPPQYGLYAGMIPPIVASLFGSSWHLMSGPTTAASIVLFTSLSALAEPLSPEYVGLALTLTFMVGVIEFTLGVARMGTIVNFISHSVVVGFTTGAAILIASKQLKNFFGVPIPRGGHLIDTLSNFWHQIPHINGYVTIVAMATLVSGLVSRRLWPRVPNLIVALLTGTLTSLVLNYAYGEEVTRIPMVGAIPQTLPPLSMPTLSLDLIKELAPAAVAMTLFALTEAVSIARAIGIRSGQMIDGNQEFIGQGLSNIIGSFFSAYVATGSFNRTSLNYQAGAQTPLSATFAGIMEIFIVLAIAPLVAYMPTAAMAGILFIVAWRLIDFAAIRHIWRSNNAERAIFTLTFLGALFLDLEFAILAGILLSLVLYLMRVSRPRIVSRVPDPSLPGRKFSTVTERLKECPQLHFLRIDGSLFFGSVPFLLEKLAQIERDHPDQKHLAIIAQGISFVDLAAADVLANEAEKRRAYGGGLYLINVKKGLWDSLEECHALEKIDYRHIFQSKSAAIHAIFQKLDRSICRTCTARIFLECQSVEYIGDERAQEAAEVHAENALDAQGEVTPPALDEKRV